ncbi:MAG: ribonuclease Z [Halobacteriales archaeon]|nr:ribonuclease Z [Halobacteriales archaeon]
MFRVTFLGTGGSIPQAGRSPSAITVEREGDLLLFDCGEGTQRQMMKYRTGFTVDSVFVTHKHGDHLLGLPGLTQTWTFQGREEPVRIYCPHEVVEHVRDCVELAGHRPPYEVEIKPVGDGTVVDFGEYEVRAFETEHGRLDSVGYALVEEERKGRFDRERAEELGVPPGPLFSKLHEGEAVELDDGTTVEPEQVVGEPRPGRKFVYTGDTRPTERTVEEARDASLLAHDGMFADDNEARAHETGHSTAREAAELAERVDAKLLALTHVSSRYSDGVAPLENEAREVFEDSFVASDGDEVVVEYPEKDRETRLV